MSTRQLQSQRVGAGEDARVIPTSSVPGRPAAQFPVLLTLEEVARALRVNSRTIRRMVAARRMPCVRIGRRLRFVPGDVFRWLEAQREA